MRRTLNESHHRFLGALSSAPAAAAPPDTIAAGGRAPPRHACASSPPCVPVWSRSPPTALRLVAGAAEQTIHIWDWPIVKTAAHASFDGADSATCVVLAPDGKTLLLGTNSGVVLRRDVGTGEILHSTNAARSDVRARDRLRPDSRRFVTYGDSVLRLWDGRSSPVWETTMREEPQCLALAGDRVFAGCHDGTVRSWDLATRGNRWSQPRPAAASA